MLETGDKVVTSQLVGRNEFGVQYAFLGGGETYRRLDEVATAGGARVIVPPFCTGHRCLPSSMSEEIKVSRMED